MFTLKDEELKVSREEFIKNGIPKYLGFIEKDLIENGANGFVSGNKLTFADV